VIQLLGNEINDQCVTLDLSLAAGLRSVQADRVLIE
jgi:hypothetical protein